MMKRLRFHALSGFVLFTALPLRSATLEEPPPVGGHISCSDIHTCTIRPDRHIECWGSNEYGQTPPSISGAFEQVTTGVRHTCALKTDGTVDCWGSNNDSSGRQFIGQATPPSGRFIQVDAGGYHTCAIEPEGDVVCWGDNRSGESAPPRGIFVQITSGLRHTCGILRGGKVKCWGNNGNGQAPKESPEGTFEAISAGRAHTCGLHTDGTLSCWGDNSDGQSPRRVASAGFVQVSSGAAHTCALRMDGNVVCWGSNEMFLQRFNQATAPVGAFEELSAGFTHNCAIRKDWTVYCWGANTGMNGVRYGQALVPPALASQEDAQTAPGIQRESRPAPNVASNPSPVSADRSMISRIDKSSNSAFAFSILGVLVLAVGALLVLHGKRKHEKA